MAMDKEREALVDDLDGVIADCEVGNGFDDVCLRTIKRVRDALTAQQEPVAWMWLEGAELLNGTEVEQFERVEFSREKPDYDAYGLTPLYIAPPSGVQEGMLRAAEIVRNGRFLHDKSPAKLFADEAAAAITRAAEQVNAEIKVCKLGCTVNCGSCNSYAPLPQPADGVVVPRELLAECRDDVAECMGREGKPHRVKAYQEQLAQIDALLAAAKEPR